VKGDLGRSRGICDVVTFTIWHSGASAAELLLQKLPECSGTSRMNGAASRASEMMVGRSSRETTKKGRAGPGRKLYSRRKLRSSYSFSEGKGRLVVLVFLD